MGSESTVGDRVRDARKRRGLTQAALATTIGMTPDALSRAENSLRGFAAVELARIAGALDEDLYWLSTGETDPFRVRAAARHHWDVARRAYVDPDGPTDRETRARLAELYRAAFPSGPPPSRRPGPADETRAALRLDDGVDDLDERIEETLGIDVVRLPGLGSAYSMSVGGRSIIIVPTSQRWFRTNWSVAHELGHLAATDIADQSSKEAEDSANAYAADLLLPAAHVRALGGSPTPRQVADFVWTRGISVEALGVRLRFLRVRVDEPTRGLLTARTRSLLADHLGRDLGVHTPRDQLIQRARTSAQRRLPPMLVDALRRAVEEGAAPPHLLAWALDTTLDDIDFPEPVEPDEREEAERRLERQRFLRGSIDWAAVPLAAAPDVAGADR